MTPDPDPALLREIALSLEEYRLVVQRLGRVPNRVELGITGALWSEHCGYKHSKLLLRQLPGTGPRVVVGPGEENAGAVSIGDGLALVMKMESHNHPSAIEPYEGAATGVGGIVRDIFTMGARPIALLNSLRFGPLDDPRNRYLFGGVVAGIAGYGNCLGIPDVGGELFFDPSYNGNPLVNALCAGLVEERHLKRARAEGVGNPIFLVGAETGRDGIHGATFASEDLHAGSEARRPAVQVGNPFLEKLLLEACLDLAVQDWVVAIQDLGAAGLTSSAVECAARAGAGVEIDVARVPRRERGMTPYDIMLSESQERMLVVVQRGHEEDMRHVLARWELTCAQIGVVTGDGLARVRDGADVVAELPIDLLMTPPLYELAGKESEEVQRLRAYPLERLPDPSAGSALTLTLSQRERGQAVTSTPELGEGQGQRASGGAPRPPPYQGGGRGGSDNDVLLRLLASPNLASREWVYRQYDHQVMTNTVLAPGADAAVLRVRGTQRAVALTSDCNGRWCYLDPYVGAAAAVAEAARNLACVGARPLAVTDCLNFGNPERPEIAHQLREAVRGLADACRALDVPVISGNVSLYNESQAGAIYPTPAVGMAGLIEDVATVLRPGFQRPGDIVLLLGADGSGWPADLAGSEYLALVHGLVAGAPGLDLGLERRLQRCCLELAEGRLLRSAHDCAEGGLAVAIAECCIHGGIGLDASGTRFLGRADAALFGERASRIVASVAPDQADDVIRSAARHGLPWLSLGTVGGDRIRLGPSVQVPLADATQAWHNGLPNALGEGTASEPRPSGSGTQQAQGGVAHV